MEAIADAELAVALPREVEELLAVICAEQKKPPVDADLRRNIDTTTPLSHGYIIRLLERYRSPACMPDKALRFAGSPSPFRSPMLRTVRIYSNRAESEAESVAEARACSLPALQGGSGKSRVGGVGRTGIQKTVSDFELYWREEASYCPNGLRDQLAERSIDDRVRSASLGSIRCEIRRPQNVS